jgi:hypothetical protein
VRYLKIILLLSLILPTSVSAKQTVPDAKRQKQILPTSVSAKQTVPDAKRQKQIRVALIEHGYTPGRTWPDTVQVLKKIAREHYWQSVHVPDARVLILLGLGNKYSDQSILDEPPSRLERGFYSEKKP